VPGEAADDLDLVPVVRVRVDVRGDAAAREAAGRLPTGRAAGPLGRLLQGADALLQPRHLLPGGDADRAELAFDLPLEQAADLLAVLAGAPQQVLGDPADLPGLDLSLLGEQPSDPLGLGAGHLPQALRSLDAGLRAARRSVTLLRRPDRLDSS
jgi:hypothetical protein